MRHFTPKQRRFIAAYIVSRSGPEAARTAGYSEKDCASRSVKLLKNADIKREIDRLIKLAESGQSVADPLPPNDDPLEFLIGVMRSESTDPRLRLDAAKTLAAYMCVKPGAGGKKQQLAEAAKNAGTKFKPTKAPNILRFPNKTEGN